MSWSSNVPAYSACKPFRPAMVTGGGATYINFGYWFTGVKRSKAVIDEFVPAFEAAAREAGRSPEVVNIEAGVLKTPAIWQLSPVGDNLIALEASAHLLSFNVRFGVSSLGADEIRRAADVGKGLRAFDLRLLTSPTAVAAVFKDVPKPVPETYLDLISFLANLPTTCDAAVYSTKDKRAVIVSSTLRLDVAEVKAAVTRVIPKPTPQQQATSRLVCFWCGASPLSEGGVKLRLCKGCECVAYCSEACVHKDWVGAHHLECGRTKAAATSSGQLVLPCDKLSITRIVTEVGKPRSGKIPVGLPPKSGLGISILLHACVVEGAPGPLPIENGWQLNRA